jgi:ketosteroid isomerase-like protein
MKEKDLLSLGFRLVFVMAIFFCIQGSSTGLAVDLISEEDKAEVNALLDKYILAFRTRNLALASEVYAHDGDLIVYGSNPSDRRQGWGDTEEYLKRYFASVDSIEIALKERNIKIHESGDVAWFAQVLTWKETEQGKSYTMDGLRITGVLEKRGRGWVIVQLHASGPPPTS